MMFIAAVLLSGFRGGPAGGEAKPGRPARDAASSVMPSDEGVDALLAGDIEEYISKNYQQTNLSLKTEYEYYTDRAPELEAFLPEELVSAEDYRQVRDAIERKVDVISVGAKKISEDPTSLYAAVISFSHTVKDGVPGYVIRLYNEGEGNRTSDKVQQFMSVPLDDWLNGEDVAQTGNADGGRQYTLGDVFSAKHFYKENWMMVPSMTSGHDWQLLYRGYVRDGEKKNMLVALQVLCDNGTDQFVPDYIGYISSNERLSAEASVSEDGAKAFSKVLAELCGYLALESEPTEEETQFRGEAEDPGPLENETTGLVMPDCLELISGPVSEKTGSGYRVSGALQAVLEPEDVIVVTVKFYDEDGYIHKSEQTVLKTGMGRMDTCKFEVDHRCSSCVSYKISSIECMPAD